MRAGTSADALGCIRSGWVKVLKKDSRGREVVVRVAGPGDILGAIEVIQGKDFECSAIALTDVEVCWVSKSTLDEVSQESSKVCKNVLLKLSAIASQSENAAMFRASKSVRERVALTLLDLLKLFGKNNGQGSIAIDAPISRSDIAGLAGTVLESAVRQLSDFRAESVLDLKGRQIVVRNRDALEKIAGVA